jgi:uncharacterized damage-inducible protein DinB
VDDFVLRHAPGPSLTLQPQIERARAALNVALAALRPVDDRQMEFAWDWNGEETDVRYGFYRLLELLEGAAAHARRGVGSAGDSEARAPIAAATAARWEWHGVLSGLSDTDLDADPGGGEWAIRETLGHTLGTQRAYSWVTAWWLSRRDATPEDFPPGFPQDQLHLLESHEDADRSGSLADMRARMDELMDAGAARFAVLDHDELETRARWSGIGVTVGFRLWRWSSHLREHTVQVDKTLAMLGRTPTEAERLLRLIAAAYGRLEAEVLALPTDVLEREGPDGRSAAAVLDEVAGVLERYAASIPAAAIAAVPVTAE